MSGASALKRFNKKTVPVPAAVLNALSDDSAATMSASAVAEQRRERQMRNERNETAEKGESARKQKAVDRTLKAKTRAQRDSYLNPSKLKWLGLMVAVSALAIPVLLALLDSFSFSSSNIVSLSVTRPEELTKIYFGSESWVIACVSGSASVPALLKKVAPLAEGKFNVGQINCNAKLPSGKSTLQRFNLQPLPGSNDITFVVANGRRPVVANIGFFENQLGDDKQRAGVEDRLLSYLVEITGPAHVKRIKWAYEFRTQCMNKANCIVLVNDGQELEDKYEGVLAPVCICVLCVCVSV
jgi:hypothetical protein